MGRLVGRAFGGRVPSAVGRVDTRSPAVPPEVQARLLFRLYERAELRFVTGLLRTDLPVVEVGASIGVITIAARRRLAAPVPLLAVEANPALIEPLRRNLAAAGVDRLVTVVHGAVAPTASGGTVRLALGSSSTDSRLAEGHHDDPVPGPGIVEVPAFSLGDLLTEHGVDGDFSLIADIEGAEATLLEHEGAALARCRQAIFELHDTTLHGAPITWAGLLERFEADAGFSVAAQHGPVAVLEH